MKNIFSTCCILLFIGTQSLFGQNDHLQACLIPFDISLDSLVNLSVERYAPSLSGKERYERIGGYTLGKLKEFRKALTEEPLDSLFQFSKEYLAQRLGQDLFCKRVRVQPQSFSYWRGEVEFEFYFYFKDNIKENRTNSKIRFEFKKQKNGEFEFTPPGNILPCAVYPEKCEFNFLSLVQVMDTVQARGLLDIAFPYDIGQNSDEYEIVVRTPGGDGFERHIRIDMRDGNISEDTIGIEEQYHYYASIDQAKKASLVVEAERIKTTKGYWANQSIYTSHIFKINKVFKGEIGRDTFEIPSLGGEVNGTFMAVSHSLNIPSKGIFFLEDFPNPEQYQSEDSLFNYPKKYMGGLPLDFSHIGNDVPPFWTLNVEGFLYPKLEEYAGHRYKEISCGAVTDTAILGWLKAIAPKKATKLAKEKGLLLGIWRAELDAEKNRLEVFVAGSTSQGFSYPTKMKFILGYNPNAFGSCLASKGKVEINRNVSRTGVGSEQIPQAFFPAYYNYSVKDISPGVLEFIFEKKDTSAWPAQLLPKPDNAPIRFDELLFSFFIPIVSDSAKVGLRILNKPFDSGFLHHDYLKNTEKPYAFVHTEGGLDYPASDKTMPVISGFKADTVQAGSKTVVDVWGSNFLGERSVAALRCEQCVNGTTYTRYCRIPKEYYTYRSASHLKFTVPDFFHNESWLDKMHPVTGTIYIINLVGDEDNLVESEKLLTILPK